MLALAACVDTASEYRCSSAADCMLDGNAGRCEPTGHCSFPDQTCGMLGFRYHASAGDEAGICVLGLAPIQEISPFDLEKAHDSVQSSCAPAGAKDMSFELTTEAPDVIAIDTGPPGGANVAISVHAGACPASKTELACAIQNCGPLPYASLALDVAPGTYCITVEETPSSTSGSTGLRVMRGGRPALVVGQGVVPQQMTCGGLPDPMPPSCGSANGDPSAAALVMMCPGSFDLSVNVAPAFSAVASLREVFPTTELDCKNNAGPLMLHTLTMVPGPYWVSIDHYGGGATCGSFDLSVAVTPH